MSESTSTTTSGNRVEQFVAFRKRMNERILSEDNKVVKRFFALDKNLYGETSRLDIKTKEMLGLVASLVLRCDDCVSYHIAQCKDVGLDDAEIFEVLSVGLVVGGSIVIPHMRRAVDFLDQLKEQTPACATHDQATHNPD